MDYPKQIIAAYADDTITRQQLICLLAAWQRSHGIDYTCRGTRIGRFLAVTYRGIDAVLDEGALTFVNRTVGGWLEMDRAGSFREFRRKVDFTLNGGVA